MRERGKAAPPRVASLLLLLAAFAHGQPLYSEARGIARVLCARTGQPRPDRPLPLSERDDSCVARSLNDERPVPRAPLELGCGTSCMLSSSPSRSRAAQKGAVRATAHLASLLLPAPTSPTSSSLAARAHKADAPFPRAQAGTASASSTAATTPEPSSTSPSRSPPRTQTRRPSSRSTRPSSTRSSTRRRAACASTGASRPGGRARTASCRSCTPSRPPSSAKGSTRSGRRCAPTSRRTTCACTTSLRLSLSLDLGERALMRRKAPAGTASRRPSSPASPRSRPSSRAPPPRCTTLRHHAARTHS